MTLNDRFELAERASRSAVLIGEEIGERIMKAIGRIWSICRQAVLSFVADNALSRAAAISFYATTSLAPILLIVIAVAGLAVGHDAAKVAVSLQFAGLLGPQGAELVETIVHGASSNAEGTLAATVAVIALIITASGVFGEMQSSLNQIWKVQAPTMSLSALVRARVVSLGLVAALGFLLLVSLAASTAIAGLSGYIDATLSLGAWFLSIINVIVSVSLIALLFGAIYKVLPDRSLAWRDVRFGAVTTSVLFVIGKALIGWYLGTTAIASSYGAAGGLIVLLLWVFYSSCIFLFGAEITRAYAMKFGTRQDLRGSQPEKLPRNPVERDVRLMPLVLEAIEICERTVALIERVRLEALRGESASRQMGGNEESVQDADGGEIRTHAR